MVGEHVSPGTEVTRKADALGIALALAMTLPLAFRRRYPIGVLVVTGVALLAGASAGYAVGVAQVGTVVAIASAAYFTNRAITLRIGAVVAGVLTVTIIAAIPSESDVSLASVIATIGSGLLAVWIGDLLREARANERRIAELANEQDRMQIAREVHDVVGHSLVGIALAGARRPAPAGARPGASRRGAREIDKLASRRSPRRARRSG